MTTVAESAALLARNDTRGTVLADRVEVAAEPVGQVQWPHGSSLARRWSALWLPDSNGIHMMFMRFPIDAVFVGRPDAAAGGARRVISVHPALAAWTGLVPLVRGAHGVLELPVGTDRPDRHGRRRPDRAGACRDRLSGA